MSCAAAFFIGLLIGVVVVISTFLGIYYYQQKNTENYVDMNHNAYHGDTIQKDSSYPPAVREKPQWFDGDNDKFTKQFLKGKVKISAQENYARIDNIEKQKYINDLIGQVDTIIDQQIANPTQGTTKERWEYVKERYKKNIQGLNFIEQYVYHQFAYTINKGEKIKLCLCDEKGVLEEQLNLYVLLHELTHIYDEKFLLNANAHDDFFWTLFSRLILQAMDDGFISPSIFSENRERCGTKILSTGDLEQISEYAARTLMPRK